MDNVICSGKIGPSSVGHISGNCTFPSKLKLMCMQL